jgi:hypothetical protein
VTRQVQPLATCMSIEPALHPGAKTKLYSTWLVLLLW